MKIGELAEKAGVNIQTVRFYEREGILRKPPRTSSGYRAYADKDLQHVIFVKVCQGLGFSLNEIRLLAGLHASMGKIETGEEKPLQDICKVATERLRVIDEKIKTLQGMRRSLLGLLDEPTACPAQKSSTT